MAEIENKSYETWIPRVEAEGLPQRFASRIVELILLLRYITNLTVCGEELFGFSVKFDLEVVSMGSETKEVAPKIKSFWMVKLHHREGPLSYIYSAPPLKLGIAIVNDFKSVEGDRAMGLQSLPVAFGTEAAKWICVSVIDATQLSVTVKVLSLKLFSKQV
ncbi:hypothetical protein DY000_02050605 [Brassica cretica]|uniref:Uncharacterized protein n=1 Tax=Brassica cretica TaxID=69181 RepID=A0ABQ7EMT3_BRACR|nr:hypothetical protein DY000_02050605 [Brassica cretica]